MAEQQEALAFLKQCNEKARTSTDKAAFDEWLANNKIKILDALSAVESGLTGQEHNEQITIGEIARLFNELNQTIIDFISLYPEVAQERIKAFIDSITKKDFLEANKDSMVRFEESAEGFRVYIAARLKRNLLAVNVDAILQKNDISAYIYERSTIFSNDYNKPDKIKYANDKFAKSFRKEINKAIENILPEISLYEAKLKRKTINSTIAIPTEVLEILREKDIKLTARDELIIILCLTQVINGNKTFTKGSLYQLATGQSSSNKLTKDWQDSIDECLSKVRYIPFKYNLGYVVNSLYDKEYDARFEIEDVLLYTKKITAYINNKRVGDCICIPSEPALLTIAKSKISKKGENQIQQYSCGLVNIQGLQRYSLDNTVFIHYLLRRIKDMNHSVMSRIILIDTAIAETEYNAKRKRVVELMALCFYSWAMEQFIKGATFMDKNNQPLFGIECKGGNMYKATYAKGKKSYSRLKMPPAETDLPNARTICKVEIMLMKAPVHS